MSIVFSKIFSRSTIPETRIQQGLPNRLLTLTLPTGLGKTITSFAVANRMKTALGKQYKIIYAVPSHCSAEER